MTCRVDRLLGTGVALTVIAVLGSGAVELVATAPASSAGLNGHPVFAFEDGPPPRVTGGFGEDSCVACHWDDENDGVGELVLSGLPEAFEPGATYRVQLTLTRTDMPVAGFQMAIRHAADASQAGSFAVPDGEGDRVAVVTDQEVEFVQHRLEGTRLDTPGEARWTVDWQAPESDGAVLVHVSALAADGDRSQLGDFVYTLELKRSAGGALR